MSAAAVEVSPYLRHVPAPVRALSARVSDAVLLRTYDAVDAARVAARDGAAVEAVEVPGFGRVDAVDIRTVWGWLVDVVKSRHTSEWEAVNDSQYRDIEVRAAALQGVEPAAVDWDAVPDDIFDGKPSALDNALTVLRAHVNGARVRDLYRVARVSVDIPAGERGARVPDPLAALVTVDTWREWIEPAETLTGRAIERVRGDGVMTARVRAAVRRYVMRARTVEAVEL